MFIMGARFTNDFYIKTSIDPDNGNCIVEVELTDNEGNTQIVTGQVEWNE